MAGRTERLGEGRGYPVRFLAISTFNTAGLQKYGRRMISSFCRQWPEEVPLRLYSEGWKEEFPAVAVYDLLASSPWLAAFKARHKARTFRDYRWDAVRFAHKVAAVCHAARGPADYLIWLDGDTFTHSPISVADLEQLAPKTEWIAWLDRAKSYPECGFYILNCRHPRHFEMIVTLERMYRDDELFGLKEFHDSYVLEQVVKMAGIETKSLSGEGHRTNHPVINGPLGKWLDHLKGSRKEIGRTPAGERQVKDGVAYWS